LSGNSLLAQEQEQRASQVHKSHSGRLSQSRGLSGVCFWVQSLSIKVICFYIVFNGLALGERGARKHSKNP